MNRASLLIVLLSALIIYSQPARAQRSRESHARKPSWDLTYLSVLDKNRIGPDEWIRKWIGRNYQSPVRRLITRWRGEPIISSILIEMLVPHGGDYSTTWYVRTKDYAYVWQFLDGRPRNRVKDPVSPQLYDKMFAAVSSFQQAAPMRPEETPGGAAPGYMGFLSLYDGIHSRQMLVSLKDFVICDTKECKGGKPGRLSQAIEIIESKGP